MNRLLAAAAITAAFYGLKRWLDSRNLQLGPASHSPTESWENEGGSLRTGRAGRQTAELVRQQTTRPSPFV